LDLSTDDGKFRAYIYSSPTVVDLDGDGNMDILVGTSYGFFYVLDHNGNPLLRSFRSYFLVYVLLMSGLSKSINRPLHLIPIIGFSNMNPMYPLFSSFDSKNSVVFFNF